MSSRAIFVTGATGFLGSHFIKASTSDPGLRFHCLVRSKGSRTAQDRLDEIVGPRRAIAVEGDLRSFASDVGQGKFEALAEQTAAVFHFAANTNFAVPLESLRSTNVDGTRAVLQFAQLCRARNPAFSHLAHVSTAYVAGKRTGTIRETDFTDGFGFNNDYERSKYEAEALVRSGDVPSIVYRPSVIIGRPIGGTAASGNPLLPVIKQVRRHGTKWVWARRNASIDFVEVGFVAAAIAAISGDPANIGETFHLAAGATGRLLLKRITALLGKYFGRRISIVPYWTYPIFIRPLLRMLGAGKYSSRMQFVEAYGGYLTNSHIFETANTDSALRGTGLACPNMAETFLAEVAA